MSKLGSLLDRARVLALAGDLFLERGERYVSEGRVRAIDEDGSAIAGKVSGTHDYEVRIGSKATTSPTPATARSAWMAPSASTSWH